MSALILGILVIDAQTKYNICNFSASLYLRVWRDDGEPTHSSDRGVHPTIFFSMGRDSLPIYPLRISARSRFVARGKHADPIPIERNEMENLL